MSFSTAVPEWAPILDLQDWKSYNQYPLDKTDQDAILSLIVQGTSEWISTYLGRPVAPTQLQERFDGWAGWSGSSIVLPYAPVLEVVSVSEYWGLSGQHQLVEQTPEEQYGVGYTAQSPPGGTYQINRRTGLLTRTFPGLVPKPFFPGSRNVEVTWVAGFDPIPAQLKLAAYQMADHWYRNTQEQPQQAPPFGGASGEGQVSSTFWPGVPANVVDMLQPYVRMGVG